VANQLRGSRGEQRCTVQYVAEVVSEATQIRGLKGSGDLISSFPSYGLCILVLVAVEPSSSGGTQWAYACAGRGSTACFVSVSLFLFFFLFLFVFFSFVSCFLGCVAKSNFRYSSQRHLSLIDQLSISQ
jgi:hypothetical protein